MWPDFKVYGQNRVKISILVKISRKLCQIMPEPDYFVATFLQYPKT